MEPTSVAPGGRASGGTATPEARHEPPQLSVRAEIALSWRRSAACGITPDKKAELPYDPDFDSDSRLLKAATPVVERLASSLADTSTSILLADRQARIVRRWVGEKPLYSALDNAHAAPGFAFAEEYAGTNGLGTVLEEARTVAVRGEEHYADFLRHLSCVGVPIHNPVTRAVEGVLDITCLADDYNPLIPALLSESVQHIETRLSHLSSPADVALVEAFTRARRLHRGAILGLNPNMILTNPIASGNLTPHDQAVLWDASTQLARTQRSEVSVDLTHGRYRVRCEPVTTGSHHPAGVVLYLDPIRPRHVSTGSHPSVTATSTGITPPAGRSPQWRRITTRIQELAQLPDPVAITGEPGSGKLYLAKYLHELSSPARGLRVFNAADPTETAPKNLIIRANETLGQGDNVIVRRIEYLPTQAQAQLRALAATSPHPTSASTTGRLIVTAQTTTHTNEWLEQALASYPHHLWVPPLAQHTEDIADLTPVLLTELAGQPTAHCSLPTLQALMRSPWPGNIAELRDALAAALNASDGQEIQPHHLPTWVLKRAHQRQLSVMDQSERELIIETLASVGNNRTQAARILGIGRATLYRKIRTLGISTAQELQMGLSDQLIGQSHCQVSRDRRGPAR
ncbi:transcriptional regulator of acetoin/glycerol metabolism [Saccharomonospora amisosensis]|uniref:Transcriptional activator of acetoin/glycerol metabolism n=2 Tax=Saccharomonospora TaxID=1851 RepID=H5X730_9PSEU|nr:MULTISPECIES: helix-turn-helix domain-containing protein [Saccharomonospora]EHR53498.1 transcriptional activator of acetoin/glycerol metabolism [Saccharomonospora marina XMU15]NIJ09725.1 transcriptional regulator of acetoin/glycerol metabolism [Saccharomonospora amisosensis]